MRTERTPSGRAGAALRPRRTKRTRMHPPTARTSPGRTECTRRCPQRTCSSRPRTERTLHRRRIGLQGNRSRLQGAPMRRRAQRRGRAGSCARAAGSTPHASRPPHARSSGRGTAARTARERDRAPSRWTRGVAGEAADTLPAELQLHTVRASRRHGDPNLIHPAAHVVGLHVGATTPSDQMGRCVHALLSVHGSFLGLPDQAACWCA